MQSHVVNFYKFTVVKDTPLGAGCFANAKIEEGEIICKMTGPVLSTTDFFDKYHAGETIPLQFDRHHFIDLIEPYCFFNHSCLPNAGMRNDGILFALREIQVDEEIMFDYSTTADDGVLFMECLCGQDNCRRQIVDFQSIPHDRKEFYFKKNALTNHIKSVYY